MVRDTSTWDKDKTCVEYPFAACFNGSAAQRLGFGNDSSTGFGNDSGNGVGNAPLSGTNNFPADIPASLPPVDSYDTSEERLVGHGRHM
jgi:hypothetical protein